MTSPCPPQTFYWNLGTVNVTELALSYYVYLTGTQEGEREAGSYATNESAVLYYTNWVGYECKQETVSPHMPWGEANVSYGFYLVNENGEIINAKKEVLRRLIPQCAYSAKDPAYRERVIGLLCELIPVTAVLSYACINHPSSVKYLENYLWRRS